MDRTTARKVLTAIQVLHLYKKVIETKPLIGQTP